MVNEIKTEMDWLKRDMQIAKSKAFNLQMMILTGLPVVYFTMFQENFKFSSNVSTLHYRWIWVLGVVPCAYRVSLFAEIAHTKFWFRTLSRIMPLAGVGLWKLVWATTLWKDVVLATPWLTIQQKWTFEQKMEYAHLYLNRFVEGKLVTGAKCQMISKECETLKQMEERLQALMQRLSNPTLYEQVQDFVYHNRWQLLGCVALVVVGSYMLSSLSATFTSNRAADLQRINELEAQVNDLMNKTRDLSKQLSLTERATNHNQRVVEAQFEAVNARQETASLDLANVASVAHQFVWR
jgi:hypothetical protein